MLNITKMIEFKLEHKIYQLKWFMYDVHCARKGKREEIVMNAKNARQTLSDRAYSPPIR
jgi:hypothetical protein